MKAKYIHVTDLERKAQGLGQPPGRVTFKIPILIDGDKNRPRPLEDIQKDIDAKKAEYKIKNEEFIARTGYKVRTTYNLVPLASDTIKEKVYKYEALNLRLDAGTGNTTCIFGSSKRGKSTAMMRIYRDYYRDRVVTKEAKGNKLISVLFAHNDQLPMYTDDTLIKSGDFRPEIPEAMRRIQRYSKNKFEFLILIDDFIDLKHVKIIDDLILTLRNSLISTVMCLQYVNSLSKSSRSNVNNVLLFGQNTDEAAEVCINVYLKTWFRKQGITNTIQVFHEITRNYGFFHVVPATGEVTLCKY